jgi:hypothetical protein
MGWRPDWWPSIHEFGPCFYCSFGTEQCVCTFNTTNLRLFEPAVPLFCNTTQLASKEFRKIRDAGVRKIQYDTGYESQTGSLIDTRESLLLKSRLIDSDCISPFESPSPSTTWATTWRRYSIFSFGAGFFFRFRLLFSTSSLPKALLNTLEELQVPLLSFGVPLRHPVTRLFRSCAGASWGIPRSWSYEKVCCCQWPFIPFFILEAF